MGSGTLAIASAGLSLAGGVSEGIAKKTAGQIQALKLKQAAEAGRIRATQTDAGFREELSDVQSTMSAIRSSQNVGFDSATSFALYDAAEEKNRRARMIAVSNERLKALGLDGDAAQTLLSTQQARTTALIKSAPSMIDAISKASSAPGEISSFFGKFGG